MCGRGCKVLRHYVELATENQVIAHFYEPTFVYIRFSSFFLCISNPAMFLHAGVIHFAFNMIGFVQIGAMIERVFGWWRVSNCSFGGVGVETRRHFSFTRYVILLHFFLLPLFAFGTVLFRFFAGDCTAYFTKVCCFLYAARSFSEHRPQCPPFLQ